MNWVFFGVDGSGDWRRAEWEGEPKDIPDRLETRRVRATEVIDEIAEKREAGWDCRETEQSATWAGPGTSPLRIVLRYVAHT